MNGNTKCNHIENETKGENGINSPLKESNNIPTQNMRHRQTSRLAIPSGSDSTPTSARMVPYISEITQDGVRNEGIQVQSIIPPKQFSASSHLPPYGPGGQELLNKTYSHSDNSLIESDIYSQASNFNEKNLIYSGIYSTSGFDVLSIMAKIYNRPSPRVELGPIDMSSSFVVSDARKYDFPIIYVSSAFEQLSGYKASEVIGRNCRFLQAPDGHVSLGSRRRYTDNNVVYRIKNHIFDAKEHQSSIVNYKKNGQPFINLLTIIPIFDNDEVIYYVGFQVDLIEQPNSILQKMKGITFSLPFDCSKTNYLDGSYKVNYSMLSIPKYLTAGMDDFFPGTPYSSSFDSASDAYVSIVGKPRNEESHRIWNQLLIEHADDMIFALTIKGVFLYVSPSSKTLLGYTPEELIGYSVSKVSHSSDLVPLVRELKEIGSSGRDFNLIHRAKRKDGSILWIESAGCLHSDNGKGRKCVILSARARPIFQLSNEALNACGGVEVNDIWSKLSLDGLYLFISQSAFAVTGYTSEELIGTSMYQYMREDRTTALTRALHQARDGVTVRLRHFFKNTSGQFLELTSNFYPGDNSLNGKPSFIICQTRLVDKKKSTPDSGSDTSFSSSSAPSPCTVRGASEYDNMFDMLDSRKTTTWQFELNQIKLENKKLKSEIDQLEKALSEKKSNSTDTECALCKAKSSPKWRQHPKLGKLVCLPCHETSKPSSMTTSSGTGAEPRSSIDSNQDTALKPT